MNRKLTITFVVDTYGVSTNGTTITAMRSVEALRDRGHTVRIITGSDIDDAQVYSTGYVRWPVLYRITKSQGMMIAKTKKKVLKEAIRGSDIIHFLLPFPMEKKGKAIVDTMGIPSSAAFHLQPENITSTLHLEGFKCINTMIYASFRRFYNRFTHVHCPSKMIKEELRKRGYSAQLHVISNGVDPKFRPKTVKKPEKFKDRFVILMIGRLSREKRQDLVIEAVRNSRFSSRIQIIFAGQGPKRRAVEKLGRDLDHPPVIGFYNQDALLDVINYSDLYVHAADIEIEAISCIEAFSCGLVPVISDSPSSATNQFALNGHNLFKNGDPTDLSDKIDYFYTHPEEKEALSMAYVDYAKKFTLSNSIDELETMFYETIGQHKKNKRTGS